MTDMFFTRRPSFRRRSLRLFKRRPFRGRSLRLFRLRPFRGRSRRPGLRPLGWAVVLLAASFVFTVWRGDRALRPAEPAIAVWNARAASVHRFALEEYVHGVVAAEMPADFHPEALKAQAVAARTYALRRVEGDERLAEHGGAHVSSDYQVHQAWIDEARFVAADPDGPSRWDRIGEAVAATRGLVLTYGGEPIEALYHSTSGGHTEDAADYFAGGLPYLRAVPDPFGDHSPVHTDRAVLPAAEVLRRLGVDGPEGPAGDEPLVHVLSRTAAGRAATVVVGGKAFTGREVREALGLRSSWFEATTEGERVVFDVRGYGHGVGMAQYGADGMGRRGYSFEEILAYYYPGAALERRY